jgi:ubiquinone/menaquinone biosynthesis C-methylase UbiE
MKRKLILLLRSLGLMLVADKLRFAYHYYKTSAKRRLFVKNNTTVMLPPPYYIYETFKLNYDSYYWGGKETAQELVRDFSQYKKLSNISILDWGCGPGRIARHLPQLLKDCNIYGTDYNQKYITWCKNNIPSVSFKTNSLAPPLQYEDNFFDIIYGISIFTHLSAEMHVLWTTELNRILKPGGILYITTHGIPFKEKLSLNDRVLFDKGELVYSKNTKEGHRTFVAFHPEKFMLDLFKAFDIIDYIPGSIINNSISQDTWVVKKVN